MNKHTHLLVHKSSWKFLILCTLLIICHSSFSEGKIKESKHLQGSSVSGKVTDLDNQSLPGVSVSIKGTSTAVSTDENGNYTILGVPSNGTLVFSYMGYNIREVSVDKRRTINVILEEESRSLSEVVVVGYGTVKKSHLTGSVTKLTNENLDEIATSRLDNALVGQLAGVNITNVSSEVGAAPQIRVRGLNSVSADSEPLVVVDGYPVPDGLSFVNPQDVASIEVLKDAASAAIYGSRGANGVILITTKSGKSDQPRYTVKSYVGFKNAYKLNPIMTFSEYADMLYQEAALRELDPTVPANRKNLIQSAEKASYVIENQIFGQSTDWQREGLRDASIANVQFNISGGKKDLRYYVSSNVQKDQGVMKFSENERLNLKAKVDGNLSNNVSFSLNFNPTYTKTDRPTVNYTNYYRFASFIPVYHNEFTAAFVNQNPQWSHIRSGDYAQARHFNNLTYHGTLPDGSSYTGVGVVPWSTGNNTPLSQAATDRRATNNYRMLGGGDISVKFLKDLIFKSSIGGYFNYQEDERFTQTGSGGDGEVNEAVVATRKTIDVLWENTLNYNQSFGNHNVTGLLGYTVQQTNIDDSRMVGRNFPTEDFETLNQAAQIDQSQTYTLKESIGLISYLGRITYDYKGKYLFSSSLRTDGSSYFKKGRQYGWFPSISTGWRVTEEPFMNKVTWLSDLKLRVSYGATGNNRIESFAYQDLLYPGNYAFGAGTGEVSQGLSPNSDVLSNPSITWERTFEYNAGFDAAFVNNRFSLTMDYYNKVTEQLLFKQSTMSFSGSYEYWNNIGRVRNQGLEIEVGYSTPTTDRFHWKTNINVAANKNKLLSLGGESYQYNYGERNEVYAAMIGSPAIQYFGYQTDGVWTSDEQIQEAKDAGLTSNLSRYFTAGGLKFVDVNDDNIINEEDRTSLGTPFPAFTWGFSNTLKFSNVDLYILLQGVQGAKVLNGDANYNENKRYNRNFTENRWISAAYPGDGKTPYYTNGESMMLTDYVIENASYAAVRSVILGYTLSRDVSRKIGINNLRVFGSVDNLLYLTGDSYRGINPEALVTSNQYTSPLISGYQRGAFPINRTFTLGLDVRF